MKRGENTPKACKVPLILRNPVIMLPRPLYQNNIVKIRQTFTQVSLLGFTVVQCWPFLTFEMCHVLPMQLQPQV